MRWGFRRPGLPIFLAFLIAAEVSAAQLRTTGDCSPIVMDVEGNVEINVTCPTGLSSQQLQELKEAIAGALAEPPAVVTQLTKLSERLGVQKSALRNFFKILERDNVAIDDLDQTLREIAKRHLALIVEIQVKPSDESEVRAMKSQAVRTIEKGDYEPAEVLLSKIEDAHLAAAERLQAQAEERFLSAARTRAERAQLRRAQFDYLGAAGHFETASERAPASRPEVKAGHLLSASRAWRDFAVTLMNSGRPVPWTLSSGPLANAKQALERAFDLLAAPFGRDSLEVSEALIAMAELNRTVWRGPFWPHQHWWRYGEAHFEEARGLFEKAIENRMVGREEAERWTSAVPMVQLAAMLIEQARWHSRFRISGSHDLLDKADGLLQRAIALFEASDRAGEPDHVTAILEHGRLERLLMELRRDPERFRHSRQLLMTALGLRRGRHGEVHPLVAEAHNSLGLLLLAALPYEPELFPEAEEAFMAALRIWQQLSPPAQDLPHPDALTISLNLAQLYKTANQPRRAGKIYDEMLQIMVRFYGPEHPALLPVLDGYANLIGRPNRFSDWAEGLRGRYGFPQRW